MSPHAHDRACQKVDRASIRRFDLFREMPGPQLEEIVGAARVFRVQRGRPVFRQGDPGSRFFFLLEGRLKVVRVTPHGQEIVVRLVHPGEIFGVAKALRRSSYPGTATAVANSVVLAWSSTLWDDMVDRHPSLATCVLHSLGQHVQEAHARIRELSTEDVEHRVAHAVVRLGQTAGRRSADGVLIDFPITLQDIAGMAGTTHFTVSRLLGTWESAGLISHGRQRLILRNLPRLEALADGAALRVN